MARQVQWRTAIALTLCVFALCLAGAQGQAVLEQVRGAAVTAKIPADPDVRTGQFDNGLRYYIRANKQPANRAELRLAVNAGSILEDDDQQGLAHFTEHMAFNGSKNFPKDAIPKFMESIGMRFGPSVNAFTSFDQTVYMLQIPMDKREVLEKAFLILEDWSHNLTFDPVEIDKERGVIVEEWRLGRGAATRVRDRQLPIVLKGSRYADRIPIGQKAIIETFKPERLKKFYSDWYRPDLMAVVAVGDFDPAVIEGIVKKHFAALPKATTPKPRPTYGVPAQPGTFFAIATDKEYPGTSVTMMVKSPEVDRSLVGGFRQTLVERLYGGMFAKRMSELAQKADAPFLGASAAIGGFGLGKLDVAQIGVSTKEDGVERGLDAVLTESDRVLRFGFTPTELDRQKKELLRAYERRYAEREKQVSAVLADTYVSNFTDQTAMPSVDVDFALAQRFVPEITLDEVNRLAKRFTSAADRVVTFSGPEKPGMTSPDEAKLAAVIGKAAGKDIKAWVDSVASATLLETPPAPGKIVDTMVRSEYGITEWTLSNGVKVVLKPTTNKADEVLFRAVAFGGTSLASDADYIPASSASQVVPAGGLGKFTAVELRNLMAGKVASASVSIGDLEKSLSGMASAKDLESLFQLIYLRFTAPRADPAVFAALTSQLKTMLGAQKANPAFAFSETLTNTLSQNHLRGRMTTADTIDQWNLEKSMAFYKERLADASGFTFVFVGSFTVDAMKPFVERYLAALPSTGRKESWKDVGLRLPKGVVEKVVQKGIEPKGQVAMVFSGPFVYDPEHRIAIRALGSYLDTRLREVVREDLGGTYGISASPSYTRYPEPESRFTISFGCNPQRVDELVKAVLREIDALKTTLPTEKQVTEVREGFLRDLETSLKDNNYLASQLTFRYQYGEPLSTLFQMDEAYKKITAATIQDAAKAYLNAGNYVKVVLLPEAAAPAKIGLWDQIASWMLPAALATSR